MVEQKMKMRIIWASASVMCFLVSSGLCFKGLVCIVWLTKLCGNASSTGRELPKGSEMFRLYHPTKGIRWRDLIFETRFLKITMDFIMDVCVRLTEEVGKLKNTVSQ
ncbi:uncharacterized protein BJX67DRAFT_298952 [Aspergillus lucknowensis]|uniref:Uncharacterized protein n=1 Tax=Aspergillus lucknowensis TaxID=176173 RepID=A0ABR4LCT8_9EURO